MVHNVPEHVAAGARDHLGRAPCGLLGSLYSGKPHGAEYAPRDVAGMLRMSLAERPDSYRDLTPHSRPTWGVGTKASQTW
ncbi:hypothetical protein U9M48_035765 [Paspalum notatum var. saurae]|uniref:Uncharacterized protein n=1 Tax=Paspalum notatum var. saurae TaxID=547442 RepID=A0AAQ3UDA4_PASNO